MRTAENPWGFYDHELTKRTRDWKQIYDYGPPDGGAIVPQLPRELPGVRARRSRGSTPSATRWRCELRRRDRRQSRHAARRARLRAFAPAPHELPAAQLLPAMSCAGAADGPRRGARRLPRRQPAHGLRRADAAAAGRAAGPRGASTSDDWHLVEPRRDALVVNIGDIVQVWSNDRYKAALHRGLASADAERFSAPFFFNPAYSTQYAPLAVDGRRAAPAALPADPLGRVSRAPCRRRLRRPRRIPLDQPLPR